MKMFFNTPCSAVIAVTLFGLSYEAKADIIAIGPFTGSATDTFNQYNSVMAVQTLDVFGGLGTISNLTEDGAIKVEWSSNFGGDLVTPISGMMMGQLGIGQWDFNTPVTRFGGWWENNSGADDATLEFYDVNNVLIGEMIANVSVSAQQWQWNGWESDTPISRIVVTGNGIINGFLWYENMQIDLVPTPGALALFCLAGLRGRRRRREE